METTSRTISLMRESDFAAAMASVTSRSNVSGAGPPDACPRARRTGSLAICSTSSPSGAITSAALRGTMGMEVCSAARMNPKTNSSRTKCRTLRIPSRIRQTNPKNPCRAEPTPIQSLPPAPGTINRRLNLFVDARGFTGQIAQIVELGAPHGAAALHADLADGGTERLEHALHALAVRDLAYRERGVEPAVLLGDD